MQVFDDEGQRKIDRHRRLRAGKGFITIEQPCDIQNAVSKLQSESSLKTGRSALLECMSNLVANEMFPPVDASGIQAAEAEKEALDAPENMKDYETAQISRVSKKVLKEVSILSENVAELVLPTVLLYEQLLHLIPAKEIIITADRFIDGIQLLHIGNKTNPVMRKELEQELISLFHTIGARYLYDKKHAQQVERLSLIIFDKIAKAYGMGEHERLLLRATCILHDIGKYICMRSHSIYTYQLIMSTDIIGLSEKDKKIVALASYYHANRLFDKTNTRAPQVEKELVPVVAKLAAIVRLADALDRSYMQKIHSCSVTLKDNKLKVLAASKEDLTLEIWTFDDKSTFFEEVFGIEPILERVNK